jgi:hypothetical protein
MPAPVITTEEFVRLWNLHGSAEGMAKELQISVTGIHSRRRRIETKLGISLRTASGKRTGGKHTEIADRRQALAETRHTHLEHEMQLDVADGVVVVFSDAHYWPGIVTTAHQALVTLIKRLKPVAVVANGDVLDGATISRHPRAGWEQRPSVAQEIETLCLRMREIEKAAGKSDLYRTLGNHDSRFENYIAANAPALEGVHGTSLFDFLPRWRAGYVLHVNPDTDGWTVIRHVHVTGGIHSAYNSTVRAGTHYVHGHLHKLQVVPFGDYRGRRYGVDTGTLAEPTGPQFAYVQGGPLNWCSGFAVLTFRNGRLLMPELCEVIDGQAWFRGEKV